MNLSTYLLLEPLCLLHAMAGRTLGELSLIGDGEPMGGVRG